MKIRTLGAQGLNVSALRLGCMGMSSAYENQDESEAVQTIHRAMELDITFFDTAEVYNDNEQLVGRGIRDHRERAIIATKFGFKLVRFSLSIRFGSEESEPISFLRCEN